MVAVVVYRIGTLLFERATGIAAAVFCTFLCSHQKLLGLTGEIELWANLPRALGVYLVVRAVIRRGPMWIVGPGRVDRCRVAGVQGGVRIAPRRSGAQWR